MVNILYRELNSCHSFSNILITLICINNKTDMNFVNSVLWGVAQIFCLKESSDWAVHNFVISYMDGPIVFCGGTVHEISIGALYSIF